MSQSNPIEVLVGEQVSAVAFVTDYVELHFNGPILRCIAHPAVEHEGQWIRFPNGGSRDALCALIGSRVQRSAITEGVALEIEFDSGDVLRVPLDDASQRAGEWAHFVTGEHQPVQVW